ncbi:glycosyltransferase family protein [Flavobacterium daejeonense]|uniref:glycosyltransferase family 2 protein n=1 Tax=Flavobacterium daejeonense TaxID=350893 RepID=UPI00047AB448|nr:glycosyltransferase family 2 protein [Flavobacterium daejeonense]
MRVGFNPNKNKQLESNDFYHQVIIPVYIPNQEGYFKDSFTILQLCLESLFKTVHDKTFITIVNNGSCFEVSNYLGELYQSRKIQELINTKNIGRINAILKAVAGHNFTVVTASDADVLFLEKWQEAAYEVFKHFPKTGAVCTTPSSKSYKTYTANIFFDCFFFKRLRFTAVQNSTALRAFAHSIENPLFYNEVHLANYLTISSNDFKAVVGAGHFVITYKASLFYSLPEKSTEYVLGGNSNYLLDTMVIKKGFWRLSTADNYTYHMGNVAEAWMFEEVTKLKQAVKTIDFQLKERPSETKWGYYIKSKIFGKFILNKKIMKCFLRWKGLSKREAEKYLT